MVINGVPFNHTMSYVMPIRSTQEWRITGGEGPTSFANMHPYHQHVSHFQLVDTMLPEDMTKAKFAELEQLFGVPGDWRQSCYRNLAEMYVSPKTNTTECPLPYHCACASTTRLGDTVATFLDLGYRMRFQPKIGGELMIHCHILNHEDKGMMTITNVTV